MIDLAHTPDWHVHGHDWAVDYLHKSLRHGRTRHAYLITGPTSVGKHQLARYFAMALNCLADDVDARPCGACRSCRLIHSHNHPDMLYIAHDERSGQIKVDAVRDVARLLALKPYDSRYRVAMLAGFDQARPLAQDAMLKTLEEPAPHAVLILMAQSPQHLLATITSRCQILRLRPVPVAVVAEHLRARGASHDEADLLARLSGGRIGWAVRAFEDPDIMDERADILAALFEALASQRAGRFQLAEALYNAGRNDAQMLRTTLEMWQTVWRDVLLLTTGSPVEPANLDQAEPLQTLAAHLQPADALQALQATRQALQHIMYTNAHVRMILEVMLLDYPGLKR